MTTNIDNSTQQGTTVNSSTQQGTTVNIFKNNDLCILESYKIPVP